MSKAHSSDEDDHKTDMIATGMRNLSLDQKNISTIKQNLQYLSEKLTSDDYRKIRDVLVEKSVISKKEKQEIDRKTKKEIPSSLIDILKLSPDDQLLIKYKALLQAMERSGDINLKQIANTLGGIPKESLKYEEKDLIDEAKGPLKKFKDPLNEHTDKSIIDSVLLLIMVVNSNEFLASMCYFGKNEGKTLFSSSNKYYVGKWGGIPAALVKQSHQGDVHSKDLTDSSIKLFKNLKAIIALGVCATVGRLGDVIVSSRIDACNSIKIKGDRVINEGNKYSPGADIHRFLSDSIESWEYLCTKPGIDHEEYSAKAISKHMLSGAHLIASADFRDKLIKGVSPEAMGIEMEGIGVMNGIISAEKLHKIQFIIVKAGCDYADESKNKEWQPVAAMAAADFVYKQLSRPYVIQWFMEPTYLNLLPYFEEVDNWKSLGDYLLPAQCIPRLINDIDRTHRSNVEDCRRALLSEYLKSGEVSWNKVISSLEKSRHLGVAKKIKKDIFNIYS